MWFFGTAALENFLDDHHCYRLAEILNRLKSPYNYTFVDPMLQIKNLQRCQDELLAAYQSLHLRERLVDERNAILKLSKIGDLTPEERSKLWYLDGRIPDVEREIWTHISELDRSVHNPPFYQALIWSWRRKGLRNQWKASRKNRATTHTPDNIAKCKKLGGCCSRQCGCCFKPRSTLNGVADVYTHCTPECKCCFHYSEICLNQKTEIGGF